MRYGNRTNFLTLAHRANMALCAGGVGDYFGAKSAFIAPRLDVKYLHGTGSNNSKGRLSCPHQ